MPSRDFTNEDLFSSRGVDRQDRVLVLDDWRGWVLHVSDDQGDELFVVPFTFVLGKPN